MNNSFPSYIYGHAFLEKLMFPSMLNKWSLASIYLLTNHKPKQTPQIFLEQSCVARKESNQAWEKLYHKQRW